MTISSEPVVISGELLSRHQTNESYVELLYLDGHVVRRREGVRRFSQLLTLMMTKPKAGYQLPCRDRVALFTTHGITPTFVRLLDKLSGLGLLVSDKSTVNYKFALSDDFAAKLEGSSNG